MAARSVDTLSAVKAWLQERYPVTSPTPERQAVQLSFWALSSRGAQRSSRRIDVPSWDEIVGNYPESVAAPLNSLMELRFDVGESGRLVLWHGEPGTGKTYALRALAWEWREWCSFHELLAADVKYQTGQGLSRLLNVVDGLLGQGLRILVLVTTNDALRVLHPAVVRPGRCVSRIEFVPFSADEAQTWLERHGLDKETGSTTLASLFGQSAGVEQPRPRRVGFVW